ncbi:MAG TPA: right-handed parallel beta-helix repeat-containing protein, partial [Kiritimatiellia bacterium]|nr:right-handed parallel beta-helix repeat-containing protein [Kiritimatiellia bacterium]
MRTMVALGWALMLAGGARCADFYVGTNGTDRADGTREKPFASMAAARDAARRAGGGGHRIRLLPGDYFLEEPFILDARDNGLTVKAEGSGSVTVYGGRRVTGWRRDGEKFWCADLPEVKNGTWDFRALVVNGRMPDRARLPESGTFTHQSVFDAKWLSSVGGGWERKPTHADRTTLIYNPTNLPPTLEVRNAELRVYHMWDDSLVGVASNDVARHTLHFTSPAGHPPGAFGVKKYVVFNTVEGMTRPGQWYLDRAAGRLVYWPLEGEKMASASVVAPLLTSVIRVQGNEKVPVERVTLRGFSVRATTTPLKPGGFSAGAYDGAVELIHAKACALVGMEICHVGGQGVKSWGLEACRIEACHIHHTGACGIRSGGAACVIADNHIHHVGVTQPSAVALQFARVQRESSLSGFHIRRNEIHDAPYSGMIGSGSDHLIEENLIYRVMRELHDGAAIYGMMIRTVLRGNIVRDVVEVGQGYGASAGGSKSRGSRCWEARGGR